MKNQGEVGGRLELRTQGNEERKEEGRRGKKWQ